MVASAANQSSQSQSQSQHPAMPPPQQKQQQPQPHQECNHQHMQSQHMHQHQQSSCAQHRPHCRLQQHQPNQQDGRQELARQDLRVQSSDLMSPISRRDSSPGAGPISPAMSCVGMGGQHYSLRSPHRSSCGPFSTHSGSVKWPPSSMTASPACAHLTPTKRHSAPEPATPPPATGPTTPARTPTSGAPEIFNVSREAAHAATSRAAAYIASMLSGDGKAGASLDLSKLDVAAFLQQHQHEESQRQQKQQLGGQLQHLQQISHTQETKVHPPPLAGDPQLCSNFERGHHFATIDARCFHNVTPSFGFSPEYPRCPAPPAVNPGGTSTLASKSPFCGTPAAPPQPPLSVFSRPSQQAQSFGGRPDCASPARDALHPGPSSFHLSSPGELTHHHSSSSGDASNEPLPPLSAHEPPARSVAEATIPW